MRAKFLHRPLVLDIFAMRHCADAMLPESRDQAVMGIFAVKDNDKVVQRGAASRCCGSGCRGTLFNNSGTRSCNKTALKPSLRALGTTKKGQPIASLTQ